MNLFVAIGFSNFSMLGLRGGDHFAMAFFIDGSEAHGDMAMFTTKVRDALLDPKGSAFADLKRLGDGLGHSYGAPATARYLGMKIQFTGAKETVFILELDDKK